MDNKWLDGELPKADSGQEMAAPSSWDAIKLHERKHWDMGGVARRNAWTCHVHSRLQSNHDYGNISIKTCSLNSKRLYMMSNVFSAFENIF